MAYTDIYFIVEFEGKYELRTADTRKAEEAQERIIGHVGAKILYRGAFSSSPEIEYRRFQVVSAFVDEANRKRQFDMNKLEAALKILELGQE